MEIVPSATIIYAASNAYLHHPHYGSPGNECLGCANDNNYATCWAPAYSNMCTSYGACYIKYDLGTPKND